MRFIPIPPVKYYGIDAGENIENLRSRNIEKSRLFYYQSNVKLYSLRLILCKYANLLERFCINAKYFKQTATLMAVENMMIAFHYTLRIYICIKLQ